MSSIRSAFAVLRSDARRLVRDRFLLAISGYLLAVSLAMRWIIPWITQGLRARWGIELVPFYPVIVSYLVVVLGAILIGVIGGFLLLESREDRSIKALQVSTLPIEVYLTVLAFVLVCVSAVAIASQAMLIGLALPGPAPLLIGALVGGMAAPIPALFLAAFARNKVEAFALMKLVSLTALIPVGAFFVPEPWQYLASVFPPYWVAKGWWMAAAGEAGWQLWMAGGAVCSIAVTGLLARRFRTVIYRM